MPATAPHKENELFFSSRRCACCNVWLKWDPSSNIHNPLVTRLAGFLTPGSSIPGSRGIENPPPPSPPMSTCPPRGIMISSSPLLEPWLLPAISRYDLYSENRKNWRKWCKFCLERQGSHTHLLRPCRLPMILTPMTRAKLQKEKTSFSRDRLDKA